MSQFAATKNVSSFYRQTDSLLGIAMGNTKLYHKERQCDDMQFVWFKKKWQMVDCLNETPNLMILL